MIANTSFPRRRESSKSRVCGDIGLCFRAAARKNTIGYANPAYDRLVSPKIGGWHNANPYIQSRYLSLQD